MSTSATSKRTTRDATQTTPVPWKLSINNAPPGSPLSDLNGVRCIVDIIGPPSGQGVVLIGGYVDNESQTPFVGYFNAGHEISYTLTFKRVRYTFFGVFNPSVNGQMIGLIKSDSPDGGDSDAEDEATWSAQARPVTEDSRRPGAAAENSRR